MQFVPLWTSILRSRKVSGLSDDLYRTWTLCLLAAQEHDHKNGSLPSVDDLSYSLHMTSDNCLSRLSRLVTLKFLDLRDSVYHVHDWEDWKYKPDPTSALRKRAQRERERQAATGTYVQNGQREKPENVTVTSVTSQKSPCHTPTQLNSTTTHLHPSESPVTSVTGRDDDEDDRFAHPEEKIHGSMNDACDAIKRSKYVPSEWAEKIRGSADLARRIKGDWASLVLAVTRLDCLIGQKEISVKKIRSPVSYLIGMCAEIPTLPPGEIEGLMQKAQRSTECRNGSVPVGSEPGCEPEPPPDPTDLREALARLEAVKKPQPWDIAQAEMIRAELAKLEEK